MRERLDTTVAEEGSLDEAGESCSLIALTWLAPSERCCVLELGKGPFLIGRDPVCAIPVDDAAASRRHAEISYKGPLLVLRDLGSTNGTFVNASRVEQVPIRVGSILRIGDWVGILSRVPNRSERGERFCELSPGHLAGPALRRVLQPVHRAAASDLPILIQGATGTGKELVAEYIHSESGRLGPFHAINCAAIPAEMAESELFGHRKGAFTGALESRLGHFRAAHRGTLFLDEVAELPLSVQAKVLRVVEDRKVTPLGDTSAAKVDVRIVAASHEPLSRAVERSTFRADLFARLSGLVVGLPSLAERIEDVPRLFRHFLERDSGGFVPAVEGRLIERLCLHEWPGNIRQLKLLARQLLIVHGHEPKLKCAHLPDAMRSPVLAPLEGTRDAGVNPELELLAHALREASGNITQASARVGISRARAYRLMAGEPIEQLLSRYPKGRRERACDGNG